MDERTGRTGLREWTAADGTVWHRASPRRVGERDARRLVRRHSTLVAVESSARFDLRWLDPGERKEYWERNVAGHMDSDLSNEQGLVYQATMWTDPAGHRLLLISELC